MDIDRAGADVELSALLDQLGTDEIRVMIFIARRLLQGQGDYGTLDLASDARDWAAEQREEAADLVVYRACEMLARGLREQ